MYELMSTYKENVDRKAVDQIFPCAASVLRKGISARTVLLLCPGGVENGGGIGRQMGYFLEEHRGRGGTPVYEVIDTRGPKFLDGSVFHTIAATGYFAASLFKLMSAGFSHRSTLAHINIAGRGSTVRKLIICEAARLAGIRYILHVHDYNYRDEYLQRGAVMRFFIRRNFRAAARVIVLGSREQSAVSTVMKLPLNKVVVLHNAVPDPRPAKGPQAASPCRFVFLGHLSERKGVPELLRALAKPAMRSRDWRAVLAGGGQIDEYRRLATELGIAERIEFLGWLNPSKVREVCEAADALVLPSRAEGLAMSVLEGLSFGLPVIATPVGAHTEVIESEVSGLLVPAGDVEALAAALLRLNDDPALRARLGAAARCRFLEKFDVRGYAERLAKIHESFM